MFFKTLFVLPAFLLFIVGPIYCVYEKYTNRCLKSEEQYVSCNKCLNVHDNVCIESIDTTCKIDICLEYAK